jgi:hypothetical protein
MPPSAEKIRLQRGPGGTRFHSLESRIDATVFLNRHLAVRSAIGAPVDRTTADEAVTFMFPKICGPAASGRTWEAVIPLKRD